MTTSSSLRTPVSIEMIRCIGLFNNLDEHSLGYLASTLKTRNVEPGSMVFREGDQSGVVYVVLSGELEVLKKSRGGVDARVAVFGDGDWFGEMSIIDSLPHWATARSLADCELLEITKQTLDSLYERDTMVHSILVYNIARELCRRLRVADGVMADMIDPPESWPTRFSRGTATAAQPK